MTRGPRCAVPGRKTHRQGWAGPGRARIAPAEVAPLGWLTLCLFGLLAACGPTAPTEYRSIWAELYPATLSRPESSEGTLQDAFYRAADADTRAEAAARWTAFLDEWDPGPNGFEDGMHARFVGWARLEHERLRHLEQNDTTGARAVEERLRALAAQYD